MLRISDVTRLTGLSRTTLWRLERQGQFPTRVVSVSTASAGEMKRSNIGSKRDPEE